MAIYGIRKSTIKQIFRNSQFSEPLSKKLKIAQIKTKVEMIYSKITNNEANQSILPAMEGAKNMIYQDELIIKPLWSREELNK